MHKSQTNGLQETSGNSRLQEFQHGFVLGNAYVKPADGTVSSDHKTIRLEPKVMDVLVVLACHHGEVVSRQSLLNLVWGEVFVTDDVLARCIYQLRHELPEVLEPNSTESFISTLRKRGYKLNTHAHPALSPNKQTTDAKPGHSYLPIALIVSFLAILVATGWWFMHRPASLPVNSIAVLPFSNMTGEDSYEYLADGFSEQLSHALANVPDLRVAARTSAFYFKNRQAEIPYIAEQLSVESLLEGSVRRNGALLRVTVQLVRDDGFHIWSGEYDRPQSDILKLQSDIAQEVLVELGMAEAAQLDRLLNNPTSNAAAYDLYLRGRFQLEQNQPESYPQAISLFEQAITLDAGYALAYTGLADAYSLQLARGQLSLTDISDKVETAITRALQLDAQLAEAHASRGLQLFTLNQYAEAESHLRQAIRLNQNYVRAHVWLGLDLVLQDRFSEAIEAYSQAQLLDPLDPSLNRNLGANLMLVGRPDEGFIYLKRAQQIAPEHITAYRLLSSWNVVYGRLAKAFEWGNLGLQRFPDDINLLTNIGSAHVALGQWEAAGEVLNHAYQLNSDDLILLDILFYFYLARGDLAGLDNLLNQQGTIHELFGEDAPFGKGRIVLRWMLIRHLLNGTPQQAIVLANSLNHQKDLLCGSFGEPGARLYLAYALRLTGENQQAETLLAECVEDINRIRDSGGIYPRSLYRMALTWSLAGDQQQAEQLLSEAVELGWRAYRQAWNDPLWADIKLQEPFRSIFNEVRQQVEQIPLSEPTVSGKQ